MASRKKGPAPLIGMSTLLRWLLPGMALLLCGASWVRFGCSAAKNRPPLRLLVLDGDEPWTEREVLRVKCGFVGQFVVDGDRVWTVCAPRAKQWELIRWDLARGLAERRWKASGSPVEVVDQGGLALAPAVAAAMKSPLGDLALVLHGQKAKTPVALVLAHPGGGLEHHALPEIKPGTLKGFTYTDGRFVLLTADCRQHVLEPGKPLASAPLAGCPYDQSTVLEWANHGPKGWRFVYSRPAKTKGRHALFLVEPGRPGPRAIGSHLRTTRTTRGERLDLSPGNVLAVHLAQWPSHRLQGERVVELERPPKRLQDGIAEASLGGNQIVRLGPDGLERFFMWFALSTPQAPAGPGQRSIQRWRWAIRLPTRWIAGESDARRRTLRLAASAPERKMEIDLPRAPPPVLNVIPATGGGYWLFDNLGFHLRVNDELSRTDAPGLVDRFERIWRLHHLQRSHLRGPAERTARRDSLQGLAHRLALPVVLLGWPLLVLLALPLARRFGRRIDPDRPLRSSLHPPTRHWIVAGALYLGAAGTLLWSFWQVTTAF